MVLKKPIDVPTKLWGVNSHIKGAVEEITIAKPKPYPIEIASNSGNCVVNGTKNKSTPLMMQPKTMGMLLLLLSEKRPIIGRDTIKDTI
jgi:dihydroorotase